LILVHGLISLRLQIPRHINWDASKLPAAYLGGRKRLSTLISGLFATTHGSNCSPAANQLNNQDHQRNDQQ